MDPDGRADGTPHQGERILMLAINNIIVTRRDGVRKDSSTEGLERNRAASRSPGNAFSTWLNPPLRVARRGTTDPPGSDR